MMFFYVVVGFLVLLVGAEFLVRGAVGLASQLGISKLVIGLTAVDTSDTRDLSFERSLGIMAVLTPLEMDEGLEDHGGYSVSHGVAIYLLNPDGELQAVFKPTIDNDGTQYFTVDQIYKDYRKIRNHVG